MEIAQVRLGLKMVYLPPSILASYGLLSYFWSMKG